VLQGIKLSYILKALVVHNSFGIENFNDKSIAEFLDELNSKLAGKDKSKIFLADYLASRSDEKLVDDADVYVSCALTNNFVDSMKALEIHFRNDPDIYICMDKLTHRTPSTGEGAQAVFDIKLFEERIKQTGHVVLVMSHWANSPFFHRTAVLFEVYCAIKNGCQFDIALDTQGNSELKECFKRGNLDIKNSIEWINKIDMANTDSKFKNLEEKVKNLVAVDEAANYLIRSAVRDCWAKIISSFIRRSFSIESIPSSEMLNQIQTASQKKEEKENKIRDRLKSLRGSIVDWAKNPNSFDTSALNFAEPNLDDLYKDLSNFIFLREEEVLKSHHESSYVKLLNGEVFSLVEKLQAEQSILEPDETNIFKTYSDVTRKVLGRRHPKALLFYDLYVYSLFVSVQLEYERSDKLSGDHGDLDALASRLKIAEDNLYQLMMIWESKITSIEQIESSKTLTIAFRAALPISYYKYMHFSNRREKLLLLCLNNTVYGGVWRITWIGISRKTVKCVCTSVRIDDIDNQQQNASMEVDWEVGELFKHSDSYQNTELQIKSIYLQQKMAPLSTSSSESSVGRAFFAPVPKIYCSCEDYTLLAVNLASKFIQVNALFQFRLIEIGKDATCEKYVPEFLSRYGFDVESSIDFPDEITSGSSKSAVEKILLYEPNRKSFMYDYTIKLRKQSEYATALQLQFFPFDQQKLSLEVGLNTLKQHIELVPEEREIDEEPVMLKRGLNGLRQYEVKKLQQQESYFEDEVLRDEYKIIFPDSPPKGSIPYILYEFICAFITQDFYNSSHSLLARIQSYHTVRKATVCYPED
jgi:hypothetical protein